jgi:hypothetical protein
MIIEDSFLSGSPTYGLSYVKYWLCIKSERDHERKIDNLCSGEYV